MKPNKEQKFYTFAFLAALLLIVSTVTIRIISVAKEY